MSNMERIVAYAKRVEASVTFGGCPVERLFMTETLSYSDIHIVPMSDEINTQVNDASHVYKLKVEVTMHRARNTHEGRWGWKPIHYGHGMLLFYHRDFEALLEFAANYLEQFVDDRAGLYEVWKGSTQRKPTFTKCLKHPKIGRVIHITEDPEYDRYELD